MTTASAFLRSTLGVGSRLRKGAVAEGSSAETHMDCLGIAASKECVNCRALHPHGQQVPGAAVRSERAIQQS